MHGTTMTIDDLRMILLEAAGATNTADDSSQFIDTDFSDLGYDSLALLETSSRIEREYGVVLPDDAVTSALTPRDFLSLVNES